MRGKTEKSLDISVPTASDCLERGGLVGST
nr:MAG TPA: hypothetical protein [Caudoviricetes sp.]